MTDRHEMRSAKKAPEFRTYSAEPGELDHDVTTAYGYALGAAICIVVVAVFGALFALALQAH